MLEPPFVDILCKRLSKPWKTSVKVPMGGDRSCRPRLPDRRAIGWRSQARIHDGTQMLGANWTLLFLGATVGKSRMRPDCSIGYAGDGFLPILAPKGEAPSDETYRSATTNRAILQFDRSDARKPTLRSIRTSGKLTSRPQTGF